MAVFILEDSLGGTVLAEYHVLGCRSRADFFLKEQLQIISTFLDVFFKHLSSLMLHLLMCSQLLFAKLSVHAIELQLP